MGHAYAFLNPRKDNAVISPIADLFRHYSLQQLLDPTTVTAKQLDYRLSWHLWNVLQALNYTHLSVPRQSLLHTSYAAQLESAGLCEMAAFVLLHVPDSV